MRILVISLQRANVFLTEGIDHNATNAPIGISIY